ncbi:MAG: Ig-like domain repeat protein, partial [Terracidiphilus sp.]
MGAVVLVGALNGADTVLGVTYLSGTGTGESGSLIQDNSIRGIARTEATANHEDTDTATQSLLGRNGSTAIDGAGNAYIADTDHHRIRMQCGPVATAVIHGTTCSSPGEIFTIAGNGAAAYTGDNQHATSATLNHPTSLTIDGAGNLLIADTGNNVIRIINAVTGLISTIAGNANGAICASATNSIGDSCPATEATLNQPQTVTLDDHANLYINDAGNDATRFLNRATSVISTLTVASTTTTLTSSLDPSGFGQSVTFTVTVSAASGTGNLAGTDSLTDSCGGATTTLVSGLPLNASGTATFYLSTLAVGQHAIVASYSNANDPAHKTSTSSPLIETVLEGTAVSLTSSANPITLGQSVTFTATVASLGGGVTPTGAINFYDGSAVLSSLTPNGNGTASHT